MQVPRALSGSRFLLLYQACCAARRGFARQLAPDDRCSPDRLRFRYSAPAAILSKPFQKKFEEETVQQEAVKPGPHPRRKLMKRCAKDFFTTNFIKALVRSPVRSLVSSLVSSLGLSGLILAAATASAVAQKKYDTGVTDTTIKIGNIMPYSGPASAYGIIGKTMSAYMRMVNDNGGVNGRKINFISYDDAYSPPKTVEQARKLVESDEVFLIFAPLGTASNAAIQKYMNNMKVPQLFVATGASRWGDPEHFPWTIGWQPNYRAEARIYATYILQHYPSAKIGVLYQNDDFGKDYVLGLKDVLGDKYGKMVVSEISYEISMPTVDSQVVAIKTSNPDIFINIGTPKFAAQAIKKLAELDWHPVHIMTNVSASVGAVLKPAGLDNSKGILSAGYQMDVTDPQWDSHPGMQKFRAFMAKYYPEADRSESGPLTGYNLSTALIEVLKRCGDNLTRENVMKIVANMDFEINTYLPGIRIKTSPTDFYPIEQVQMMKFSGQKWELFGPIIDGHAE
jgi:branched-chain amino acid transport system substrate-binding protein